MKTTMSQGESVGSHWSVIGNKVYCDGSLFAKAGSWPNAMIIMNALNCNEDLFEALRKCETVIGMARLQGKLDDNALSPVNDALVSARKALDKAIEAEKVSAT